MSSFSNKIIVILGPTASGKSGTAIKLAKKFNGEILSADSRQIYRGMDVGTGKVEKSSVISHQSSKQSLNQKLTPFWSEGVAHYGIDIVSPKTDYSVAKFKKYADKVIADIISHGKVPIIAGGTGFWIKSIVDDVIYPEVKPDPVLRNKLRNKTTKELFYQLKKLDPERAKNIDAKNPVRLIRAIEICESLGKVPKPVRNRETNTNLRTKYKFLQIGIAREKEELNERIKINVKKRFENGMIEEVKKLHDSGLSWKKMESFGLSYKIISQYLREKIYPVKFERSETGEAIFNRVYLAEKDYAKRQLTWFKKDRRIVWLDRYEKIEKEVANFLSQK